MIGGFTSDALVDLSGGIEENFELNNAISKEKREEVWNIICKSRKHHDSMNAAYIDPDPNVANQELSNGLIKGHAYTITKVIDVEKNSRFKDEKIKLIQIRNPWGN